MSRKIKPVFEDAAIEPTDLQDDVENSVSQDDDDAKMSIETPKVGPKSLTKEMKQKLDDYDSLLESNKILLKEKDELMAKANEMILELESLRSKNSELSKLEDEIKKMQATSDEYLMRISDLTFENAKLTSQLQNIGSSSNSAAKRASQPETFARKPDPYDPYVQNGYAGWN